MNAQYSFKIKDGIPSGPGLKEDFVLLIEFLKVSQSEWKKCFDNLFERMQKCINYDGEYFEKQ